MEDSIYNYKKVHCELFPDTYLPGNNVGIPGGFNHGNFANQIVQISYIFTGKWDSIIQIKSALWKQVKRKCFFVSYLITLGANVGLAVLYTRGRRKIFINHKTRNHD